MMKARLRWLALAAGSWMLVGCSHRETPQEVAAAFWQSMADNDASEVVELSTLTESDQFDGYKRSWTNAVPSFGRVVIEDREASIVTRLPSEDVDEGSGGKRLELVTYLVRGEDGWVVDYQRTGDPILNPSPFSGLMGQLNRLGEKLSASFDQSSDELSERMDELAQDLEAYSDELRRQTNEAMRDFSEQLRDAMKDLEDALDEALEDNDQAPQQDRFVLEQASRDLGEKADALEEPTAEHLADASRSIAQAGERLSQLSSETWSEYQAEWEERLDEIRDDMKAFFEDLGQR
ncbi:hypothetical protein FWJ25_01160 [Marinobacter salinexigens]|uniref:DUF4878 domain-containing protein n=1 Tax=Marinobacter salinexigens TaxID=2919747 RepID=A0A5B0VN49_9GAMM|nr:hypothetical protein [Marinobacter salinexigens]KAA1175774.1 hypothetical protein FWJ25_01160 [Marinobacter salinexigens]